MGSGAVVFWEGGRSCPESVDLSYEEREGWDGRECVGEY